MYVLLVIIPPLISFSNINTIPMSVSSSNFTFVIFKHASIANPGVETKYDGSNLYSLKHQLIVMYQIEHRDRDIHRDFLY